MTLLEAAGDVPALDIKVLGTDISTRALTRAMAGTYETAKTVAVPPALRQKYFTRRRKDGTHDGHRQGQRQGSGRPSDTSTSSAPPFAMSGPLDACSCAT